MASTNTRVAPAEPGGSKSKKALNTEDHEQYVKLCERLKSFKIDDDRDKVMVEIIDKTPTVLMVEKTEIGYEGQKPLHLAICREKVKAVEEIMKNLTKEKLQNHQARGKKYEKTTMMGEVPLIVAALTLNPEVFRTVFRGGRKIFGDNDGFKQWLMTTNSKDDNVFHALIKYSHLYPQKAGRVGHMLRVVLKKMDKLDDVVVVMLAAKNDHKLTPFLLAAYLGQVEAFNVIINHKTYCYTDEQDEVFDVKMYDTTEIDTVNVTRSGTEGNPASILHIIHKLEPSVATSIVTSGPISRVIMNKWERYKYPFYFWFIVHFVFMCLLTWYAAERAQRNRGLEFYGIICPRNISEHFLTRNYHYVSLSLSGIYLFIEFLKIVMFIVRPGGIKQGESILSMGYNWLHQGFANPYGNGWFRACFILLAGFLIADLVLVYNVYCYDNYMLVCAVIVGWFLMLFFLRSLERFSFFSLLMQKIILNEMLSFFAILGIEIVAFGTALYMVIQGSELVDNENYSNFWHVMISMIRLSVGNGELQGLYNTKYPVLATAIFIAFVVMTILLTLNALIAVLGQTATELMDFTNGQSAQHKHFQFQRLSIILFMESFIPMIFFKVAGNRSEPNQNDKKPKWQTLKMKSLRSAGSPKSDTAAAIVDEPPEPEYLAVPPIVPQNISNGQTLDIYHVKRNRREQTILDVAQSK